MQKVKRQFRLYDIYRYAATGIASRIEGIHSYEVNRTATTMTVRFGEYACSKIYFADNEDELREIVRSINKRLGNCEIPGPKACKRYKK
jgi:hypothetical protein